MPKGSTLKKPKTLNKNKKSNKFDLKKNWKKTAFIGMAGFLFFLSVGYGGFQFIQQKSASAYGKQLGLVSVNRGGYVYGYGCKIYNPSSNSYTARYTISNRTPVTIQGSVKQGSSASSYVILAGTAKSYFFTAASGANGPWWSWSAYYAGVGGSHGGQAYFYNPPFPQTVFPNC